MKYVFLIFAISALLFLVSKVHFLSGNNYSGPLIVEKEKIGIEETFINVDVVTGIEYEKSVKLFPKSVKVLQKIGLIESEESKIQKLIEESKKAVAEANAISAYLEFVERKKNEEKQAADNVKFEKMYWQKVGFGNVMEVGFTVINNNNFPIKDILFYCTLFGKSKTVVEEKQKTIYDIVESNSQKRFTEINMGLIGDQASSASCYAVSVSNVY